MSNLYTAKRFITSTEYCDLLDLALTFCDHLQFTVASDKNTALVSGLSDSLVSSNSKESHRVLTFLFNQNVADTLKKVANNIYVWTDESFQIDSSLLRADGTSFLDFFDTEIIINPKKNELDQINKSFPGLFYKTKDSHQTAHFIPSLRLKLNDDIREKKFDNLETSYIALVKNYIGVLEEIKNEVDLNYIVPEYDFIPEMGLKREFELQSTEIAKRNLSNGTREEFEYIKSKLLTVEENFLNFLLEHKKNSTQYFKSILDKFIDYYPSIISVSTSPNEGYWSMYLTYFQDVRNDISCFIDLIRSENHEVFEDKIAQIEKCDRELIANLRANHFNVVHFLSEKYPKKDWWYHLHEIDRLSENDLKNI